MIGRLILTQNNGKQHTALIKKNEGITFGRGKDTDIKILDTRLSRIHCKVVEEGGAYYVVDAGSTNGTFLNEEKIDRASLSHGDCITIGTTRGEFSLVDESETGGKPFGSTLRFCAECGGSISNKDIESGRAEEIEGEFLCRECVSAKEGVPVDIERATERVETVLKTPEGIEDAVSDESSDSDIPKVATVDEVSGSETEAEDEEEAGTEQEVPAAEDAEEAEAEETAPDEKAADEPAEAEYAADDEIADDEVIELSDEDVETVEEISEERPEDEIEFSEQEPEPEEPLELLDEEETEKKAETETEEEQGPAARVIITQNNGRESTIMIREGESVTVGRGPSCGLRVLDTRMSREHCTFFEKDGAYYIKDEGSTNGTFLNSSKVTEEEKLTEGDIINIGTSEGRFSILRDSEVRRQTAITFCAVCGGSISNQDLQNGMAKEIEGDFYCRDCVFEKEGIPAEVKAATAEVEKVSLDTAARDEDEEEKKEAPAECEEIDEVEEAEIAEAAESEEASAESEKAEIAEVVEEGEEEEHEEAGEAAGEALEIKEQEQLEIPAEPIIPSENKEAERKETEAVPEEEAVPAEESEEIETEGAAPEEESEEDKVEEPEIPAEPVVPSKKEEVPDETASELEEESDIPKISEIEDIEETDVPEPEESEASDIIEEPEDMETVSAPGQNGGEMPAETGEEEAEEPAPAHDTAAIAVLKNQGEIGPEELLMPEELKRAEELRKIRESGGSGVKRSKEEPKKKEKLIDIQEDDGSQWFLTLLGRRVGPIGRRKMTELKRKQQLNELQESDLDGL